MASGLNYGSVALSREPGIEKRSMSPTSHVVVNPRDGSKKYCRRTRTPSSTCEYKVYAVGSNVSTPLPQDRELWTPFRSTQGTQAKGELACCHCHSVGAEHGKSSDERMSSYQAGKMVKPHKSTSFSTNGECSPTLRARQKRS